MHVFVYYPTVVIFQSMTSITGWLIPVVFLPTRKTNTAMSTSNLLAAKETSIDSNDNIEWGVSYIGQDVCGSK
jgi:hypothetical protein